jgi:hypothetical protein
LSRNKPTEIPVQEISSEGVTDAPEGIAPEVWENAEEQAAQDREFIERIKQMSEAPPKRRPSLGENFVDMANLIKEAKKDTRLSETSLIKLWELNLMWALNNRSSVDQNVYPEPEEGGGTGEQADLPTTNEVITGEPDEETN